jgi:hypothetical protein
MSGLTNDTHLYRYGAGDDAQPTSYPLGAGQTVYYGEVALLAGGGGVPTKGVLINAATALSGDEVVGMIGDPAGGTYVKTGPGITNSGADGAVWVDVYTGAFFFQGGSGSDALSVSTNGQTVYYHGENSSGPVADKTGSGTKPVLGVQIAQDPGIAGGFSPGAGYWPVVINPAIGRP